MSNFSVFDIANSEVIDSLHSVLWDELVPESGSCESVQGELIRVMGRISSEMFRNSNINWIYGKFEVNEEGYPKGYIPDWNSDEYEEFTPDVLKCTATQEQLDNATHFDEMLNFVKQWFKNYPLVEWEDKFQAKLQDALEMARPAVPIGVISDDHWEHHTQSNNIPYNTGWNDWNDDNSDLVNAQVVYWIYRNPDLVDFNNTPLGKSVSTSFNKVKEEEVCG